MTPFVTAGAGFLLAVLWFDLMFDVQARWHHGEVPDGALASIAAYYRRVTTKARPMNRFVATVMLGTLVAILIQLLRGDAPRWTATVSLVLTVAAILTAAVHAVPSAIRLGGRSGSIPEQSRLAHGILRDHLFCASAIAAVLLVQLAFAR